MLKFSWLHAPGFSKFLKSLFNFSDSCFHSLANKNHHTGTFVWPGHIKHLLLANIWKDLGSGEFYLTSTCATFTSVTVLNPREGSYIVISSYFYILIYYSTSIWIEAVLLFYDNFVRFRYLNEIEKYIFFTLYNAAIRIWILTIK